jgi:hypothetical protein
MSGCDQSQLPLTLGCKGDEIAESSCAQAKRRGLVLIAVRYLTFLGGALMHLT